MLTRLILALVSLAVASVAAPVAAPAPPKANIDPNTGLPAIPFAGTAAAANTMNTGNAAAAGKVAMGTTMNTAMAATAAGAPAQIDLTVLNFALTLEHLEDTFYKQGLAKFGPSAFDGIGLPGSFIFSQLATVAQDEAIHVNFLQTAIQKTFGMNMAVPACTYNFDTALANVQNFITFASILERTGVQAYDGGVHLIVNNDIKTAAASIATVEGRHSSFLNLLTGSGPAPGPFETALGIRPVISIAAGLIKQCPFPLPAMPFPALTTVSGVGSTAQQAVQVGTTIPLLFNAGAGAAMGMGNMGMMGAPSMAGSQGAPGPEAAMGGAAGMERRQAAGLQCNWVYGVTQTRTPLQIGNGGGSCMVPQGIAQAQFAQAVLFLVNQNRDVTLDDDKNVVAGPATIFIAPGIGAGNMGMTLNTNLNGNVGTTVTGAGSPGVIVIKDAAIIAASTQNGSVPVAADGVQSGSVSVVVVIKLFVVAAIALAL
ncbi:ferritin-like domain-containing protein [Chytriomyces sp. MP71]|nr:ferritin-like domain-containing protein [Chytriomyces sp. MP71]